MVLDLYRSRASQLFTSFPNLMKTKIIRHSHSHNCDVLPLLPICLTWHARNSTAKAKNKQKTRNMTGKVGSLGCLPTASDTFFVQMYRETVVSSLALQWQGELNISWHGQGGFQKGTQLRFKHKVRTV